MEAEMPDLSQHPYRGRILTLPLDTSAPGGEAQSDGKPIMVVPESALHFSLRVEDGGFVVDIDFTRHFDEEPIQIDGARAGSIDMAIDGACEELGAEVGDAVGKNVAETIKKYLMGPPSQT